jgi:hypothetical protein
MHSKYIVRGIGIYAFGIYCYLLKKDWDTLKIDNNMQLTNLHDKNEKKKGSN